MMNCKINLKAVRLLESIRFTFYDIKQNTNQKNNVCKQLILKQVFKC